MDALARLEPVARPLLSAVDSALETLGAPPEHGVWALLRRVGATPADAVTFFAELHPPAAGVIHRYDDVPLPASVAWHGAAGEAYAAEVRALEAHHAIMNERATATASYVEAVAEWARTGRERMARTLAAVMTSAESIVVRWPGDPRALARTVIAAADIGVAILRTADGALTAGTALPGAWRHRLSEVPYGKPSHDTPVGTHRTIKFER